MALLVPNSSEEIMINYILNRDLPEGLVIHLYSNNIIPQETDTITNYVQVSGGGYAAIGLIAGSWTILPGTPTSAEHVEVVWTFNGAVGNVYGYYVTRVTGLELMWAERFSNGPFNIQTSGDEIRVTPRLTLE